MLKKDTDDNMIHYYLNKSKNKNEHQLLINLEVIVYNITQIIGRVIIINPSSGVSQINSNIKYLYNIILEFLVQISTLKAIYYLETHQLDCTVNNIVLLSNLLSIVPSINQHLRQMNKFY